MDYHDFSRGCVLALDYGRKRIGVAVGEIELLQAHPLVTINTIPIELRNLKLQEIVKEWHPIYIVLGLPFGENESKHPLFKEISLFSKQLNSLLSLPVYFTDETLSSHFATENQFSFGKKPRNINERFKTQEKTDSLAAQIILQTWFSELKSNK